MSTWSNYQQYTTYLKDLEFTLDASRIGLSAAFLEQMGPLWTQALQDMAALERGEIVNTDEKRKVGHYWLRNPDLAPEPSIQKEIKETLSSIQAFAKSVHTGTIKGSKGPFKNLLCIGIGGSALGPQFVSQALGNSQTDKLKPFFIDNTDPDGIDAVLANLTGELGATLCIVTSKSGSTPEPRNGMLEVQSAYTQAGLRFSDHTIAITSHQSELDQYATKNGWIARFPMWDWVGGRTSQLAAVGLVPAALQGIDIFSLLEGAKQMDAATRNADIHTNPAALLALSWHYATGGKGQKDMVILPYKDRLMLLSKYLQQLVMESLGKEFDKSGKTVNQGIAVYGNKGSTDQHAYIQQLRDGVNNFFVTFIEVLQDRTGPSPEIEPGVTAGDYLQAFLLGTREALSDKERTSITLTVKDVSAHTIGCLIALYERAVSFYASFVNINAYHQPGVEAGKKAAASILALKKAIVQKLQETPNTPYTAETLAQALNQPAQTELVFKLLRHLAHNTQKHITETHTTNLYANTFRYTG